MTMQVQKDHASSTEEFYRSAITQFILTMANSDAPEVYSGAWVKLGLEMAQDARILCEYEDRSAFDDDKLNYLSRTA